jgi:hypothetical protein
VIEVGRVQKFLYKNKIKEGLSSKNIKQKQGTHVNYNCSRATSKDKLCPCSDGKVNSVEHRQPGKLW